MNRRRTTRRKGEKYSNQKKGRKKEKKKGRTKKGEEKTIMENFFLKTGGESKNWGGIPPTGKNLRGTFPPLGISEEYP